MLVDSTSRKSAVRKGASGQYDQSLGARSLEGGKRSIRSTHSKRAVRKGASGRCIQDAKPLKQCAPARTHIYFCA